MDRRRFLQLSSLTIGTAAASSVFTVPSGVSAAGPKRHGITATLDPKLPVHPALQYGAVAEPEKKVRVIVQKTSKGADGRDIAAAHGATHLEEFTFIKSHHMEIKQKNALDLGRHKDVLFVSPDGPVQKHGNSTAQIISTANLTTLYPTLTNATTVWNSTTTNTEATGKGVTVAVLDSGVNGVPEIAANLTSVNVNQLATGVADGHGHGTHVVGIIKGQDSKGNYIGVAPNANVISIKIADDSGVAHEADFLRGLQWIYDNRSSNGGIRVVNLSICSGTAQSYLTSPLCAATEQLWLNGIVVVVAVGNRGSALDATWYPPANDPYCITVGALDDNMTLDYSDDTLATFSSRGKTQDLIYKPDLIAPARKIYAPLASMGCVLAKQLPSHIAPDGAHIRLSGTSMAAPQVAGAVALLLEKYPGLQPDQVKYLLMNGAHGYGSNKNPPADSVKIVNPNAAIGTAASATKTIPSANGGNVPNTGIVAGTNTVAWGTAYWDNAYWDNAYWDNAYWDVGPTLD